jgi:DNA-nicking Smr family endonuclease
MTQRRSRSLRPEERRLWAQIARGVTPLEGRQFPAEPDTEPAPGASPAPAAPPLAPSSLPAARPSLPPLAPIERKTLHRLRRGARAVDAVIDLHGLRQTEAHAALFGFLRRCQAAGHGIVLIVTGKGGAGADGSPFDERGVLRRVVPHWLRPPDPRPLVIGFEEASPHHGGSGALYVRLRRRRGAGTHA